MANLTAAQLKRRQEVNESLEALRDKWREAKKELDTITKNIDLPGVDAGRVFMVLNTQTNKLDEAVDPLERWAVNRLVQVEALEALSDEHRAALNVSPAQQADTLNER